MRIKSEELKEQTVQQVETITLLLVKIISEIDLSSKTISEITKTCVRAAIFARKLADEFDLTVRMDKKGNLYFRKNGTDIEVTVSKEELIKKLEKQSLKERE